MTEDNLSPDHANGGLVERLDQLEEMLRLQAARMQAIERHLGVDAHAPTTSARAPLSTPAGPVHQPAEHTVPPPLPPLATAAPPPFQRRPTADAQSQSPPARPASPRESRDAQARAPKKFFDLETHIGGSIFNWLGILALVFGVAFFLKLAFDNGLITPAGRVALGAVAGIGILIFADRLRTRGLRQYAYVLSGGGILILYLSIYAAHEFYKLIEQAPAFLLMIVVTATAVLLAVRFDALAIAMLALVGGFLTPILLSTGQDNQIALFTYIALLDAGVLTLAYFKGWRSLNYISFAATLMMLSGWLAMHFASPKLWRTLFFLTLFFLLFSLLAMVHNVLKKRFARWFDISLIIANASFYFGVSYLLLDEANYDAFLSSFALLLSAFYLCLFYFVDRRHRADRLLTYSFLGAGVTFFTMAMAIQLDQHWVTMGWAVEVVMLTWIGLRSDTAAPRHAALVVFLFTVLHWFSTDLSAFAYHAQAGTAFIPLLNRRAASCTVLVAASAGVVWLYRRSSEAGVRRVAEGERALISTVFVLVANVLAFTLLTLDVYDYFEQQKMLAINVNHDAPFNALHSMTTETLHQRARLDNTKHFALSTLWTFYGTVALILGLARRRPALRYGALALLAVTVGKVVMLDIVYYDAAWHLPLFNHTFAAFCLLIVALAVSVRMYERARGQVGEEERAMVMAVATVIANLLALVGLSAEALGYFEKKIRAGEMVMGNWYDLRLAQQLSLSVIWTIYGGALLLFGHVRGNRLLRLMALLLLGCTTLKVFFWDLSSLDRIYRIASFIVLGLILLAVSYLYQKIQPRTMEESAEGEPENP